MDLNPPESPVSKKFVGVLSPDKFDQLNDTFHCGACYQPLVAYKVLTCSKCSSWTLCQSCADKSTRDRVPWGFCKVQLNADNLRKNITISKAIDSLSNVDLKRQLNLDENQICKTHNRESSAMCKNCSEVFCIECFMEHTHDGHSIIKIKEFYNAKFEELKDTTTDHIESLDKDALLGKVLCTELKDVIAHKKEKLKEMFSKYIDECDITSNSATMIYNYDNFVKEGKNAITSAYNIKLNYVVEKDVKKFNKVDTVMKHAATESSFKMLMNKLDKIDEHKLKTLAIWEFNLNSAKFEQICLNKKYSIKARSKLSVSIGFARSDGKLHISFQSIKIADKTQNKHQIAAVKFIKDANTNIFSYYGTINSQPRNFEHELIIDFSDEKVDEISAYLDEYESNIKVIVELLFPKIDPELIENEIITKMKNNLDSILNPPLHRQYSSVFCRKKSSIKDQIISNKCKVPLTSRNKYRNIDEVHHSVFHERNSSMIIQ